MNRYKEKWKSTNFGPKNVSFPSFWTYQKISFKIQNCHFYPIFNTFHQLQLQKSLMKRFREKFNSIDFGDKHSPFIPFWAEPVLFSEKGSLTF